MWRHSIPLAGGKKIKHWGGNSACGNWPSLFFQICCTELWLCLHMIIVTNFWGPLKFELMTVYSLCGSCKKQESQPSRTFFMHNHHCDLLRLTTTKLKFALAIAMTLEAVLAYIQTSHSLKFLLGEGPCEYCQKIAKQKCQVLCCLYISHLSWLHSPAASEEQVSMYGHCTWILNVMAISSKCHKNDFREMPLTMHHCKGPLLTTLGEDMTLKPDGLFLKKLHCWRLWPSNMLISSSLHIPLNICCI